MPTISDQETTLHSESAADSLRVRVAIVGTGFSGLGLAIRLKQRGMNDFVLLERAGDVGGTWRDNTYPGCACDVPSHLYSFSFALNPSWTRTFSPQQEIWDYLRSCAERFGIMPYIRWNDEVREAAWDEQGQCWHLKTARGHITAQMLALGNGPLSEPTTPPIPGLDCFAGTVFHSARWKHDYDLTGKRVAVIGTGASAIQFVPRIQPRVSHLMLFQRTPPWILPRLDRPISERRRALFRALPCAQRLTRGKIYLQRELLVPGFIHQSSLMQRAERLALRHLEAQVADPTLRAELTPHYRMGCKRILLSDDFYPAITQDNVELVTERIRGVQATSILTEDGVGHACDTIILATGFHATDMPLAHCIYGRGGQVLAAAWHAGPRAYLGTTVAGFPNLFILIGPNTGLGHSSMIYMIESQLAYILDCLHRIDRKGARAIEVRSEVQESFNVEMQRRMRGTIWASGCASWYLDAGGYNASLWPGFTWEYRRRTRRFDSANYHLTPKAEQKVASSS